ncbi:MAG: aldo/keto reductase [Chloroflexi bacterium]|jgi:aryl-alcohol dehydrogenase-like predicted oxidoreductase|nr:aldo/keto reductase [Chloroflexota bacterium]
MELSRIGFGCWQLGGHGWGNVSEQEMVYAVHKAIDLGINLFDTAPVYGLGHSEELLGKTLGAKRKDVIIATKLGLTWKKDGTFRKFNDCSQRNIEREINMSLKRLQTDYVDLYQIHWPDPNTPIEETFFALEKLRQEGKVRHFGCCNFNLELLKKASKYGQIETLQLRYNLIERRAERALMPFCISNGISVISYSSLADGLLSGKYTSNSIFGTDDHRSHDQYFTKESLSENMIFVEKVKLVAKHLSKTPSQIALRWVLENPAVTTALVGIKSVSQIEENSIASNFALSESDFEFLSGTET